MISSGFTPNRFNVVGSIISILLVIGCLMWMKLNHGTRRQAILDEAQKETFYGTVDSVYRDRDDHNTQKVRLANGYVYSLYPAWEDKVEVGDSLSKDKGAMVVVVFKKQGAKIKFDYRELVKDIRND